MTAPPPIGIIAAGGPMPFAVAAALACQGREVVIYGIERIADPAAITTYRHHWVALAQIGKLLRLLKADNIRDITMIGAMTRPAIRDLRFDLTTLRALPEIAAALRGGDDHLLVRIGQIFERRGYRVHGLRDIAPELLMPAGRLTQATPDADALADIAVGQDVLRAIGPFDIGQAVVVIDRHVVGVEGIEGTDALLARVAQLRSERRIRNRPGRGVLVKAPKAAQDLRFDLPTVGPRTVDGIALAGLGGIAIAAGAAIAADPDTMIRNADRAGIFIVGTAP